MIGRPILCLVTNRRSARGELVDAIRAAVAGGVDWVQVRERDLGAAALLALCEEIAAAVPAAVLLVNRRVDVASALGVGVHLGFDAATVSDARRLLGAGARIGVATHAPEEVAEAARAGADYALLAPVFAPHSKPATRPPLGVTALREAARLGIPVLAQGGCDAGNARALVAAGAAGVAVTGAILGAEDPGVAAAALRMALDAASPERG